MRHVADLMADVLKHVAPRIVILPAVGMIQARQRAQQRSLACSVIAEDGIELSAGKLRGNATQSGEAAELLDQVRDGDDGRGFSQWLGL